MEHEAQSPPPRQAGAAHSVERQLRQVGGQARLLQDTGHARSSGVDLGQNQPISVTMILAVNPTPPPRSVKIELISITLVAMAAKNGQIELAGEASRLASGAAAAGRC